MPLIFLAVSVRRVFTGQKFNDKMKKRRKGIFQYTKNVYALHVAIWSKAKCINLKDVLIRLPLSRTGATILDSPEVQLTIRRPA